MMKGSFRSSGQAHNRSAQQEIGGVPSTLRGVVLALWVGLAGAIGVLGVPAPAWADETGGEEGQPPPAEDPPQPPTCPDWLDEEIPEIWAPQYESISREVAKEASEPKEVSYSCRLRTGAFVFDENGDVVPQYITTPLVDAKSSANAEGNVYSAKSYVHVPNTRCSHGDAVRANFSFGLRPTQRRSYEDVFDDDPNLGPSLSMAADARGQQERWLLWCPPPGCDCPCPEANSTYAATVAGAVVTVGIADMRRRGSSGRVDSFASLDFFGVINIELEAKIGKGVNSETQSGSIGLPPGISISVPIGGTYLTFEDFDDAFRSESKFGCANGKSQKAASIAKATATSYNGGRYLEAQAVVTISQLSLGGSVGIPEAGGAGAGVHAETMEALIGLRLLPWEAAMLMSELSPLPTPAEIDIYARALNEEDREIFLKFLDRERLGLIGLMRPEDIEGGEQP